MFSGQNQFREMETTSYNEQCSKSPINQNLMPQLSEESESLFETFSLNRFLDQSGIISPVKQGLLADIVQTQLALWTVSFSFVYTYCWQRRLSPRSLIVCCLSFNGTLCLSALLCAMVVCSHVFNKDLKSKGESEPSAVGRRRTGSTISTCSVCSRPNSGSSTPMSPMSGKGNVRFWQQKVTSERTFFGSSVR